MPKYALDVRNWNFVGKSDGYYTFKNQNFDLTLPTNFFNNEESRIYSIHTRRLERSELTERETEKFTQDFKKYFIELAL